jgi:hypothetical protein
VCIPTHTHHTHHTHTPHTHLLLPTHTPHTHAQLSIFGFATEAGLPQETDINMYFYRWVRGGGGAVGGAVGRGGGGAVVGDINALLQVGTGVQVVWVPELGLQQQQEQQEEYRKEQQQEEEEQQQQ